MTKKKGKPGRGIMGIRGITSEEEAEIQLLYTRQDLEDIRCGVGPCAPQWLQRLATRKVYMVVYLLVGVVQGMFFTYCVSVISTIEKRFKLKSKETGILMSGNDISQVMLAMFLGYYGTFGHRPRWLGVGALFSAASCFTAALPHFVFGPGAMAKAMVEDSVMVSNLSSLHSGKELCHSGTSTECTSTSSGGAEYYGAMVLLFLAQFFVGISISIFFSVGVTYLDDNVNKKTYPMYYTVTLLMRILGPVAGFLVGGKCLSMWIDPSKEPNLSREDPRWLGAWWLGLVFLGFGLVITALPFFFFPRKLPATLRREAKRYLRLAEKNKQEGGFNTALHYRAIDATKRTQAKPTISNLWKALKRLFTNKVWAGNLFASVLTLLALSGYWSFKPKYLENQFRKSAAEANYYTGLSSLIVSVVGAVVGGSVMRWGQPGPRLVTGYKIFITIVTCIGFVILMYVGCPKLDVVGLVEGEEGVVAPACSADCGCSEKFTPVCSQDGVTLFYSPCYAGCVVDDVTAKPIEYSQCKCINGSHAHLSSTTPPFLSTASPPPPPPHLDTSPLPSEWWGTATRGYCPEPCNGFFYYFLVQVIVKAISSTGHIGGSIVMLRAVSEEDKGVSLGTITVFISLFGFIPAPIIMGSIIDSACVVWESSCGVTGNCWLYDSDHFRHILHLVPVVLMAISVLGEIVVFRNSGHLDLYGLEEDKDKKAAAEGYKGREDKGGGQEEAEEAVPLQAKDSQGLNV